MDSRSTVLISIEALREVGVETREFSRNVCARTCPGQSCANFSSDSPLTEFDSQIQIHSAVESPGLLIGAHDKESDGSLAVEVAN